MNSSERPQPLVLVVEQEQELLDEVWGADSGVDATNVDKYLTP